MSRTVFDSFVNEDDELRIQLLVQPAINYALVHNRVPVVRQLVLANGGEHPLGDLEVEVGLVGPGGPLAPRWSRIVAGPLRAGAVIEWDDFTDFIPDAQRLLRADEAFPVDYRVTVRDPGGRRVSLVAPSRVLAHNEWFHTPALYDVLAAFVQPNTKAVDAVSRSAASVLLKHTGSGSLNGYQAGPLRASQIAGAVYEALRQIGITYRSAPASFEETGQKIRAVSDVLEVRQGNCLDLAVTYAACLEAAGLRPLIFLTEGHAFGGFLAAEERLDTAAVTATNLLVSLVDAGKAVPVELTGIGPGEQTADFPTAVELGLAHLRQPEHRLRGVVDVYLAHRTGIRPLPSTDSALEADIGAPPPAAPGEGAIELPASIAGAVLAGQADSEEVVDQTDSAPERIRKWKKSLLDLSLRNPLLNLPRTGRGLELHVPQDALATLDDLVHDGKRVDVIPQDRISQVHALAGTRRAQDLDPAVLRKELRERRIYGAVTEQRYRTVMRRLQRDARTMTQETGSNYLYLTIGTLVHPKSSGGEAHAPLFLLPVRIEGGAGSRPYHLVVDGTEVATPNHCLVEWLRVKHSVQIPELENPPQDEHGLDIPLTLTAIRKRLVENRLNYRVEETASLRLLQFSTFQMWRDLTDHWSTFMENPVVRHLVEQPGTNFLDPVGSDLTPDIDEAALHLPIPADGSQMRAVVMAERGQSFVLEGPPGTGKSQTITNMLARAIAAKRTVLFVAEKQAALEVVKRRLASVGLAPFALDLHGRKQSMKAIRHQLREALEAHTGGDDGAWTPVETTYRTRLAPLVDYPERVHQANPTGMSLWSAYEATLAYGQGPAAEIPRAHLSNPRAGEAVRAALRELPAAARSAGLRAGHPWSLSAHRVVDGLDLYELRQLAASLEAAGSRLDQAPSLVRVVRQTGSPQELPLVGEVGLLVAGGRLPDRAATERAAQPGWDEAVDQVVADLTAFRQRYRAELAHFRPEIFQSTELAAWHAEAQRIGKRWFGKRKRWQAVADRLSPYQRGDVAVTGEQVEHVLGRLLAAQAEAEQVREQVQQLGGLRLPDDWSPTADDAEAALSAARRATEASRALLARSPDIWGDLTSSIDDAQAATLHEAATAWTRWWDALRASDPQLELWTAGSPWYDAWRRDGAAWREDLETGLLPLQRWGEVLRLTDVLAEAGLHRLREQLLRAEIAAIVAEEVYQRGVALASLAERVENGSLEYFDAERHADQVEQYEEAAEQLRKHLPDRLSSVLVRRRPFGGQERRGRVAEFFGQLRRQRGGLSFRELFERYSDLVLALTPCLLVSPASAANFLAPGATRFDLVVFDEASQIRVAEAIGAMGRGSAAVIVGDSRQMPPTTIMQASHEVNEDPADTPVPEDMDSILSEAVESGVPQCWLSWHYRSQDETLIAFSNRYYYDNKLSSLPSPGHDGTAGIHWRRVDGRFDRAGTRTNEVEAREIVDDILRRLRDPRTRDDSIGVVTFNIQQRDLILNLLEESGDPMITERLSADLAEPIFVKNLENVQGDERDVILFSLAFSTDPVTGRLPLNFGPLSQAGGERRLNVAITRARRQVVLFASFDPNDIDLSRTNARGTQHLRAYCELAAAGVDRLADLSRGGPDRLGRIWAEVAEAIRQRGYEVAIGYGLSDFSVDIAVREPGSPYWQAAVILDGPHWRDRPTVADRDGAPALLHRLMKWPVVLRFWLPEWIRDRDRFLDRLDEAVKRTSRVLENDSEPAVAQPAPVRSIPPEPGTTAAPVQAASTLPQGSTAPASTHIGMATSTLRPQRPAQAQQGLTSATGEIKVIKFQPYVPDRIGDQSDLDLFPSSSSVRSRVRDALFEVLTAEGPIEQNRLARLTLQRFGFQKAHEERRTRVLSLLRRELIRRDRQAGSFVWPPGVHPDTWRVVRTATEPNMRTIEEVPPEEIANAACAALARAPFMEADLLRSIMEFLGFRRKTDNVERRLRLGLRLAIDGDRIAQGSDGRYRRTE